MLQELRTQRQIIGTNVGDDDTEEDTNNIYKTWVFQQITGSKDEPYTILHSNIYSKAVGCASHSLETIFPTHT